MHPYLYELQLPNRTRDIAIWCVPLSYWWLLWDTTGICSQCVPMLWCFMLWTHQRLSDPGERGVAASPCLLAGGRGLPCFTCTLRLGDKFSNTWHEKCAGSVREFHVSAMQGILVYWFILYDACVNDPMLYHRPFSCFFLEPCQVACITWSHHQRCVLPFWKLWSRTKWHLISTWDRQWTPWLSIKLALRLLWQVKLALEKQHSVPTLSWRPARLCCRKGSWFRNDSIIMFEWCWVWQRFEMQLYW